VVAVRGAMTIASAQSPISTWLFQLSSEVTCVKTFFFDKVESVSGVTKAVAA